jgi:lysozyme family protein
MKLTNNFEIAFEKLIGFEGGYVNDKDDKGGETKFGISKRSYPNVDIKNLTVIDAKNIYKNDYWDVLKCDYYPQIIAEELFELAVNTGIFRTVHLLQKTINVLNRNQKLYSDIKIDGKFGVNTFETFKNCLESNKVKTVFNILNILQGAYYIEIMENNSVNEKYIGWFERVEVIK